METRYFGRITVLHGVSLEVPRGRIVAVLGSNGAGKSTLLRTISGLIPDQPEKGSMEFEGRSLNGRDPEAIAAMGIGHVLEGRGVFGELSVAENLQLGAYTRREGSNLRRDMDWVLELFPILGERQRQEAGTLSGGEQQMLVIARALLARPKLLLLDEPSIGLAPRLVGDIFRTIAQIRDAGTTVLLVEQNARMALRVADYGYVLETGRIVLEGTREELEADKNVQELYLGIRPDPAVKGFRRYRPRRRWA